MEANKKKNTIEKEEYNFKNLSPEITKKESQIFCLSERFIDVEPLYLSSSLILLNVFGSSFYFIASII